MPACAQVGDDMFEACYPRQMEKRIEDMHALLRDSPERVRLAFDGCEPSGLAVVGVEPHKRLGSITQLGVRPSLRSQGVGSSLCMDAFEWFRKEGMLHARVMEALGEVTEESHALCCKVGMSRELPSVDYFAKL